MLKRKLQSVAQQQAEAKRMKAEDKRLDILFTDVARPTNVIEAINYIKSLVIWEKFCGKIPPVVLKNQIYAVLSDRSQIDKELSEMRQNGVCFIIKLDSATYAILLTDDYQANLKRMLDDNEEELSPDLRRHLTRFDREEYDIELSKSELKTYFKDELITELVRAGFLTSEYTGMFYRTIPNASLLLRHLLTGIKIVTKKVKRSKFREILLTTLLTHKQSKNEFLTITYCVLNLIGNESVKVISTTTGPLLRYVHGDELNN